jgi:hypothetical protein
MPRAGVRSGPSRSRRYVGDRHPTAPCDLGAARRAGRSGNPCRDGRLLPRLRRDPLGVFVNLAREYGDVVCIPAGPRRVYLLNHPDHVRRVLQITRQLPPDPFLQQAAADLRRRPHSPATERPGAGAGTCYSQRSSPGRSRWANPPLAGLRCDCWSAGSGRRRAGIRSTSPKRRPGLTLEVVARAMFGVELDGRAGELGRAIPAALETAVARTTAVTDPAERLPTARNRRFVQDLRALDEAVYALVERRRRCDEEGGERDDLLAVLMAARHPEAGRKMSTGDVRPSAASLKHAAEGSCRTGDVRPSAASPPRPHLKP